jgi:hypothetical protein
MDIVLTQSSAHIDTNYFSETQTKEDHNIDNIASLSKKLSSQVNANGFLKSKMQNMVNELFIL